jgi:two-component system NtrC family sensor kinase
VKGKLLTSWSLIWLVATVLLVAGGALNLSQRTFQKLPPTDGVLWVNKTDGVYAEKVVQGMAGSRAGISAGDKLIGIGLDSDSTDQITTAADVQMYLETAGVDGSLTYFYQRPSYSFKDNYYFADLKHIDSIPRWTPGIIFLSIVGLIWLSVGIFVLFKQGSQAPFVLHFASLCLAAFVFHVYSAIGFGEDFDLAVGLLDNMAFAFFVPLFLHFCIRYPVRNEVFEKQAWRTYILYAPAAAISLVLLTISLVPQFWPQGSLTALIASWTEKYNLFGSTYRILFYHFVGGVSAGACFLVWRFVKNHQAVVRQRLKWAMWGTLIAIIPVLAVEAIRRLGIFVPEDNYSTAITTLPLALIPLSFGHSVVRYRLMDVDIVVRRALVYALTTIAIAAMIGGVALGLVFLAVGKDLSTAEITLRALIAIIAMAAIVLLSEPLKKYLQERADRYFYGERYDLRQGLLDFGRTLSATTSLGPLLDALTGRLQQVLDLEKLAVFIEDPGHPARYRIAKSVGLSEEYHVPADFRSMIRQKAAESGVVRADELDLLETDTASANGNGNGGGRTLVRQELHYFVPCVVGSKMVAVIGLGRARDGGLLSSEDLDILKTISGYVGVAVENSRLYEEQKIQNDELALLKEFNESIVESVNVGLLAVDEDGRITRCNSPFEEMMGLDRAEAAGKFVNEVFDEGFARNLDAILGMSRWHLTEVRNAYKLHTSDVHGRSLIVNVAVAPLRSISNQQSGAIIVLENVTSRVKLEESLQQSEKLSSIGLLAAGVAHEVNTPLTGVSSYTQMLLGMVPETDPKHALLQKMHRQTERASNIVGNLLNFSRTGNSADFSEIDVNKLLNDTLQLLEPQLRKSNINIVLDYFDSPPRIYGNGGKLQQVFTNLILNARDAMFNGGTITLSTSVNGGGEVSVKVSDTGEGIPPENLGKVFDPFFTTKGVGNGTGLGLAVTYGIVQEHGGTIEVKSDAGCGAEFTLVFPPASRRRQRALSR